MKNHFLDKFLEYVLRSKNQIMSQLVTYIHSTVATKHS